MDYRVDIRKDKAGNHVVSFPDLPWVHTFGTSREDALTRATDAFLTGVEFLIRQREAVPEPRATAGTRLPVSARVACKIALHNAMVKANVNRAELARRLHAHRPQADRLLDLRHGSQIDQIEAAFTAIGKRMEINVADATKVA